MRAGLRVLTVSRHPTPYRDPLFDRLAAVPGIDLRVLYLGEGFAQTPWERRPLAHAHAILPGHFHRDVAGMDTALHPRVVSEFLRFRPSACLLSAWSDPTVLGLMALCRAFDVPYVLGGESFESTGRSGAPSGLRRRVMEWALRGASVWLPAGTRATAHFVRHGADPGRCHPHPTAPDARRWASLAQELRQDPGLRGGLGLPDSGVITFVGRLVRDKAPGVLLDAYAKLREQGRACRLVLVGEGPERARLEAHRIAGEVDFRGFLQPAEVARVLAASDAFALPSRYETWGAAACEALACGLPVVLSERVGSAPDLVGDGRAGRCVPAEDPAALAAALAEVLDDPHRRGSVAQAARRRAIEWGHDLNLRSTLRALADAGLALGPEALELALDEGDASGAAPLPWAGRLAPLAYVSDGYPKLSETFTQREVRGLVADGLRVTVFSLRQPGPDDPVPVAGVDAPTCYLPAPGSARVLAALLWWCLRRPLLMASLLGRAVLPHTTPWVLRLQLRAPFHVAWGAWLASRVHAGWHLHAQFCWGGSTVAWVASRLRGAPFSVTEHADLGLPFVRAKVRDAAFVVAISEFGRRRLLEHAAAAAAGRVVVNRLGVDVQAPAAPPQAGEGLRLLSVGTLGPKKGHDVLLAACALLRDRGVRFQLDIVGEGPERERLERLLARTELAGVVDLLGAVPHARVTAMLADHDAVVLACRTTAGGDQDGIPVALMEAMAAGRPVVSTLVSGIPELVVDGQTGLAVLPERPDLLADALESLALDAGLRLRLGEAGRRHVAEQFDARLSRRRLTALFERHLMRHPPRAVLPRAGNGAAT